MKSLIIRTTSSLVGISICLALNHFFSTSGLLFIGLAFCVKGIFEYEKILVRPLEMSTAYRYLFLSFVLLFLTLNTFFSNLAPLYWSALIPIYLSLSLWLTRNKYPNEKLLAASATSVLGFVYCALLPSFALSLITVEQGRLWFLFLLGVVFAGDAAAYVGGILFGNKKIMPTLSPSKTFAGAIAGATGSLLAGLIISRLWLGINPAHIVPLCLLCAFVAQTGDLFESLLKRVGNVKDSGHIMPGHGGALDRLDGVYFAAPLVYFYAHFWG